MFRSFYNVFMIYNNNLATFILLLKISISFAFDGSLPIIPVENAVNPNVKGHTEPVNVDNNRASGHQLQIQESTSPQTNTSSNEGSREISTIKSNVHDDSSLTLIDDYDLNLKDAIEVHQDDNSVNVSKREMTIDTETLLSTLSSTSAEQTSSASPDLLYTENARRVALDTESTSSPETQKSSSGVHINKNVILTTDSELDIRQNGKVKPRKESKFPNESQNTKSTTSSLIDANNPNLYRAHSFYSRAIYKSPNTELPNKVVHTARPDTSIIFIKKLNTPYKSSTQSTRSNMTSSNSQDNDHNIQSNTRPNIELNPVNNDVNDFLSANTNTSHMLSTSTSLEYTGTKIAEENSNTNTTSTFQFESNFSKSSITSSLYQTEASNVEDANVSANASTDYNVQHSTTKTSSSFKHISVTASTTSRMLHSEDTSSMKSSNYWKSLDAQDDQKSDNSSYSEYSDTTVQEIPLPLDLESRKQLQNEDQQTTNTWYLLPEEENSTTSSDLFDGKTPLFSNTENFRPLNETYDVNPLLNDTNLLLTNPIAFVNESEIVNVTTSEVEDSPRNIVSSDNDPQASLNTTSSHDSLVSNQNSTSVFVPASASQTQFPQNTKTYSYLSSVNPKELNYTPHLSTKSKFFAKKYSTRRIEISDKKIINVHWQCPPMSERLHNFSRSFQWYKMSKDGKYETPLSSKMDIWTNRSSLEIQAANKEHEGRYFCVARKGGFFNSSTMYFYQIVILETKWINIGSENVVSLYHNQIGILNCPYGDIIKNNASLKGPCCSCRVTFQEHLSISNKEVYRCSNSEKTTVKMEATRSSKNCSLSLMACDFKEDTNQETDTTNNPHSLNVNHLEKCQFQYYFKLPTFLESDKFIGNIYIRFFFIKSIAKCFPIETRESRGLYSFYSLRECEQSCVNISPDIEPCFHLKNTDTSGDCITTKRKGKYKASYDIESNTCNWFYHCEQSPLYKNVFKTISICDTVCVKNEKSIKLEAIKLCYQQESLNISVLSGDVMQRWMFSRKSQECHLVNIPATDKDKYFSFATKTKCERICKVISRHAICMSRPENGDCTNRILKWHFHSNVKQCIRIFDGGCGDSLNRFDSKDACEEICSEFIDKSGNATPVKPATVTENLFTIRPIIAIQAKKRVTISQKTTFRRRFNRKIPDHEFYRTTTPKTHIGATTFLKNHVNILDRPLDLDPCLENALTGLCDYGLERASYKMIRYSFMPEIGRCYKMKFSGCKSGGNLFDEINDCKAACEFRLYHPLKSPNCQNPYLDRCVAPNNTPTQRNLTRYFYLPLNSECVEFTSIDSNQCLHQYFSSSQQCKQVCMPSAPTERMLQNRCFGKIVISEALCRADEKVYLWFYLSKIRQCLQYSTCEVAFEGNIFRTKLECEQTCQATNILTVCELAVDFGMGNGTKRRYFFNSQLGKCQLFYYKGSLGNLNRFTTKDECKMTCFYTMRKTDAIRSASLAFVGDKFGDYRGTFTSETWLNKVTDKEYCYDPHKYGSCDSNNPDIFVKKYYYDGYRKHCEPYMFSGCGSISRNSFDSMAICDKMCTERISKTVSSLCSQKVSKCMESNWIYWTYNSERGNCEPFASCIKVSVDQFFFVSEKHCTQTCVPVLPLKKDLFDICHLPPVTDNCEVLTERWYYDELTGSCLSFSGCEQLGNNFPSISSCISACEPRNLKDVCQLPVDKGPCNDNSTLRYHFDWRTQTCKLFSYGGCLGNRNKFQTKMECELVCLSRNRCNYKVNDNKCAYPHNNYPTNHFYYNYTSNKCVPLRRPFCGDEMQVFSSLDDCSQHCEVQDEIRQIVWDFEPESTKPLNGQCSENLKFNQYPLCLKNEKWLPRFFYDKHKSQCSFFYYNGCNGTEDHGNRFTNSSQCQAMCENLHVTTQTTAPSVMSSTPLKNKRFKHIKQKDFTKDGVCPASNRACTATRDNSKICLIDNDCPALLKCCSCEMNHSISSLCMEPLGCMQTRFGCCADGLTQATSADHLNCPRHSAIVDQHLVETLRKVSDDDLMLNCFVAGDPKPNITWIYLGNSTRTFPVDSKWDLIRPMWSGVAKIPSEEDSVGLWVCQARNDAGWDDKEVYVHSSEIEFPIIHLHSLGDEDDVMRSATVNSLVRLHCPIYGVPRPIVSWYYNRIAVSSNFSYTIYFNRYLEIRSVQFIHEGIWSCSARNNHKSLSHNIKLKIVEPLKILSPPMGTKIKANHGTTVVLFCNVQAKGPYSIHWFWQTDKTRFEINTTAGSDHRIVNISNVRNPYLGKYICEANNEINKASIRFSIVPFASNDIVVDPSGTLFVGVTVVLACPTKLSGDLDYVLWKKDHVHIKTKTTKLTVHLHSKSDSGFYSCQHNEATYLTYLLVNNKP